MTVIGLTGSIAMGKSTVVKMVRQSYHPPIWDADLEVHNMYKNDKNLIDKIGLAFPGVLDDNKVNRVSLLKQLLDKPEKLQILNKLVHEPLAKKGQRFLKKWARSSFVVLDVPLLYEIGWDKWCDKVVVVAAPSFIQEQRLMRRSQFNQTRMRFFIENQISSTQKELWADHVIRSGLSKNHTCCQLKSILSDFFSF